MGQRVAMKGNFNMAQSQWFLAGGALYFGIATLVLAPLISGHLSNRLSDARLRLIRQRCARMTVLAPALIFIGAVVCRSLAGGDLQLPLLCAATFAGVVSAIFWSFSSTLLAGPVGTPSLGSSPAAAAPAPVTLPSPAMPTPTAVLPTSPSSQGTAAIAKRPGLISAGDNGLDQAEAAKVNGSAAVMAGISVILAIAASTLPSAVRLMALAGTPAEHLIMLPAKHGYGKVSGSLVLVACGLYLVSGPSLAFSAAVCIENIWLHTAGITAKWQHADRKIKLFYLMFLLLFVLAVWQHQQVDGCLTAFRDVCRWFGRVAS